MNNLYQLNFLKLKHLQINLHDAVEYVQSANGQFIQEQLSSLG